MTKHMLRMIFSLILMAGSLAPPVGSAQTDATTLLQPTANEPSGIQDQAAAEQGVAIEQREPSDARVAGADSLADSSDTINPTELLSAREEPTQSELSIAEPQPAGETVAAVPPQGVTHAAVVNNGRGSTPVIDLPVTDESGDLPEGTLTNGAASLISIAFDSVPVPDVVNMFSKISGANIIIAASVTNSFITANLKNIEWKTALSLALGSVNLSLIEDPSGILMVVTSAMYGEKLQQIENTKPLVTRAISVQYLNAVDFIEQVKVLKLLSPRGTIIASQSREQDRASLKSSPLATDVIQNPSITTKILITDIKEYVDKVANIILALDKREPQVFIEARIIDVVSDDSKKLGFDWSMLDHFGATLKMQDLKWSFADDHNLVNSTINKDNNFDNRSNLDDLNRRYDIEGKEYQETTTTYEEQPPDSGNWIANTVITPTRKITDTINRGRDVSSVKEDTLTDKRNETKAGTAILNVSDVSLFLSALQHTENMEMISHPLIVVGNKVEAKIHVGERYPTIISTKQSANPQQGQTESFSEHVEWNDLGLTLWVIPEIDRNVDMIRLTVNPQMSSHVKDITTPAGSVYPVISTRQVVTRANVPSKHTVIIGGLIDNQKSSKEIRVPILSDIPLVGLLFKHNVDVISKHNLLIMLTPTILDEKAPLTGYEAVAQQSVDRLEKIPLAPQSNPSLKPVSSNAVAENVAGLTGDVPTIPSSSANLVVSPNTEPAPDAAPAQSSPAGGDKLTPKIEPSQASRGTGVDDSDASKTPAP